MLSQKQRVLAMLKRGPVTNAELAAAFIPRYGARIAELRADGHEVVMERKSGTEFQYRLAASSKAAEVRATPDSPAPVPSNPGQVSRAPQLFETPHAPAGVYDSDLAA